MKLVSKDVESLQTNKENEIEDGLKLHGAPTNRPS